tara:strand:+ start:18084 stop:19175 length:1092 start_codon:yes stop_codon:yes gene_type:complete
MKVLRLTGLTVLALAIAGGAAAWLFRADLGLKVYGGMATRQMHIDRMASLPDGLSIAFCGTGSPLPDPTRAPSCAVVIAGERLFVIDSGAGSTTNILRMGLPAGEIERVLLTHYHSDHIGGLGDLAMQRWIGTGNTRPLPVSGPPGVEQVVAGFVGAYTLDSGYRTGHHGEAIAPPSGFGMVAEPFEIGTASDPASVIILENGGLTIWATAVDHDPVSPSVAYRFDYQGRSLVISGDLVTEDSPGFQALAAGADLLVVEGLQPRLLDVITRNASAMGNDRLAQITVDILDYHTTPEQAAAAASAADARALVITHVVPALPRRSLYPAFLGQAGDYFPGPIRVAEDRMVVMLPAGDDSVAFESW